MESEINRKLLTKAINKKYGFKENYYEKIKNTWRRLKTIILLTKEYRKNQLKIEKENKKRQLT